MSDSGAFLMRPRTAPANFFLHVLTDVAPGRPVTGAPLTGDELVTVLSTLSNPHRLRVVAALRRERTYVSRLARDLGISRPLLQVHLRKLQAAGLVTSQLELSEDGKALRYYEVTEFAFALTPDTITAAVPTLTTGQEPTLQPDPTKGT